jgi:uncharacterized Zn-binding protein involved in type VI secretion
MFERLVAGGDRTTTGGYVLEGRGTYNEKGKPYARKEDLATCGNCKGAFRIYGTASEWIDGGLPLVKDRDRVLCPCGNNFLLAAGTSTSFYSKGSSVGRTTITPRPTSRVMYDQHFMLTNEHGGALEGRTDSQGRTFKVSGDQVVTATIHIFEEITPLDPNWDQYP